MSSMFRATSFSFLVFALLVNHAKSFVIVEQQRQNRAISGFPLIRSRCHDPMRQIVTSTGSTSGVLFQGSSVTSDDRSNRPPQFLFRLNSSTKWLVTLANTLGIWTRFPRYEGPFIVVGAIATTYFTAVLKKWINHERPAGAPFVDPGMPSSHSLVSFFMAAAWGSMVCKGIAVPCVWVGASIVALLRVICGYHSWDQIGVGALLGASMGFAWSKLGSILYPIHPQIMLKVFWGFYLSGSALFIFTEMRDWLHKDKHL